MDIITLGKYGRFAPPNNATSGYIFRSKTNSVVVDFGSGCMSKFLTVSKIDNLDAIILTHLHFDHISDMFTLAYYLMHTSRKIDVFIPDSPSKVFDIIKSFSVFNIHVITDNNMIKIGGISIFPILVSHTVKTFSLIICDDNHSIVYTSDLLSMTPLQPYLADANCVIGDGCILQENHTENSPHISVRNLANSIPKHVKLYLAHLSYGEENEILSEGKNYHDNTEIMPDFVTL